MALSPHALTTVQAVKDYLRIAPEDTSNDSSLERQINAVSEWLERYCNRHFEKSIYTELHIGHGRENLLLEQYPILSVESITVNENAVSASEYEIRSEEGILYRERLWPAKSFLEGLDWDPIQGKRNIEVVYTAGYVLPKDDSTETPRTLPYDLEDACIQLVAIRHEKRGSEHLSSETIGPLKSDFIDGIPPHIESVLNKYKKWVV